MSEDEDVLEDLGEEDGLWFDFTFVEFLKTNYSKISLHRAGQMLALILPSPFAVSVQRAILLDPSSTEPGRGWRLSMRPPRRLTSFLAQAAPSMLLARPRS